MFWCLVPLLALNPEPAPAASRMPQLDSLAKDMASLGFIPEAGGMIVLAASRGWPGRIGSVTQAEGPPDRVDALSSPDDRLWGYCDGSGGGVGLLVEAPMPAILPSGLPLATLPGARFRFELSGAAVDTVLSAAPSGIVSGCARDSAGGYSLETADTGVYWIEAMSDTGSGPEVLLLLPVLCGVTPAEAISGQAGGVPRSGASTLDDVLDELNSLRRESGLPPLSREPDLDSIALARAENVAMSGAVRHSVNLALLLGAPGGLFAENIGSGSGLDEAWSMILTSPAHRSACLGEVYDGVGLASCIGIERNGWQYILIQVFTGSGSDAAD